MAETLKLKNPRRKKGATFHPKDAPFPVQIESITNRECCDSRWFYYTGYFRDNCVVIENHGDLTFLYRMGFFGKGNLSRSKPEYEIISNISQRAFSKSEKLRRLPPKERQIRQSKFRDIRKERFKNHKKWYNLSNEINSAKPVELSRGSLVETPSGVEPDDTLNETQDSPERKKAKEESEDIKSGDIHVDEDEINYNEPDMLEEEEEDVEEEIPLSTEKSNRDVDEVMHDVLRHNEKQVSKRIEDLLPSQDSLSKQKNKPNKIDDPYKVFEQVQLSLEEAFFLSYGLGCLTVYDNDERKLTISEMWTGFCRAKQDFIPCYVVYHYFRSKGWVPKSGIKYGTDFVLYKQGMPFFHSSYSIIVQVADEDTLAPSSHSTLLGQCEPVSWCSIGGPNRVSEHAAKEVMICYVIVPSGITDQELALPTCIPRFKVQEVVMRRWIPKRSRELTAKRK